MGKNYGIIATWRMALEGMDEVKEMFRNESTIHDAIEQVIKTTEDIDFYKSVGYGGLPNREMVVELDAAFMDGDTLDIGMVAALQDVRHPVSVARKLSSLPVNNFLVGEGAIKFAQQQGFERRNMLTEVAKTMYYEKLKAFNAEALNAYFGHDTIGVCGVDAHGSSASATSTSGLFMKHPGRVGDSPIIGSGFYADSMKGSACATGLGEDLMKGIVSYEVVRLMGEGRSSQEACEQVVFTLDTMLRKRRKTVGDISVIAMATDGSWGAASNIDNFSFVVLTNTQEPTVYRTKRVGDKMVHEIADEAWVKAGIFD